MVKATLILTGDEEAISVVISALEGQPVEIRAAGALPADLAEHLGAHEFAGTPEGAEPYGIQVTATSLEMTARLLAAAAGGRLGENPVLYLGAMTVPLNRAHARSGILLKILLDLDYKGIEPLVLADILLQARMAVEQRRGDRNTASEKIVRQALVLTDQEQIEAIEVLDKARWWLQTWSWCVRREAGTR